MPGKRSQLDLTSLPKLCQTIALPGDNNPVRLPTYPAVERTSVLPLNATLTAAVPSTGLRGLLVKSSTMPLWLDQAASSAYSWAASWDTALTAGIQDTMVFQETMKAAISTANTVLGTVRMIGTLATPTGYAPIGEYDGRALIYIPAGATVIMFSNTATPAVAGVDVTFQTVTLGGAPETLEVSLQTTVAGTVQGIWATYQSTTSYFLRPTSLAAINGTMNPVDLTVIVTNGTVSAPAVAGAYYAWTTTGNVKQVLLPFAAPPALGVSVVPYSNTRVTACSALFTNVTKVLNKEGTVLAGRFNPTTANVFDLVASSYALLAPMEKYFFGLEKGFYTYLPLQTDIEEFADDAWDRYGTYSTLVPIPMPWLHLGRRSLVTAFRFDDPDGGTALAVNVDWHIEYRNSSILWPIAVSGMSLEEAHKAQLVLLDAGFFFDNVDHKAILRAVSNGLKYISPAVKMYSPTASMGLGMLTQKIDNYTRPTIQPTSLAAPSAIRALRITNKKAVKVARPLSKKKLKK